MYKTLSLTIVMYLLMSAFSISGATTVDKKVSSSNEVQLLDIPAVYHGEILSIDMNAKSLTISDKEKNNQLYWNDESIFSYNTATYSQMIFPSDLSIGQIVKVITEDNIIHFVEYNSVPLDFNYNGETILRQNNISNFVLSQDHKYLAVSSLSKGIIIYSYPNLKIISQIATNSNKFCFSPLDGTFFYIKTDKASESEKLMAYEIVNNNYNIIMTVDSDDELIRTFSALKVENDELIYSIWEGTPQSQFFFSQLGIYNLINKKLSTMPFPYTISHFAKLKDDLLVFDQWLGSLGNVKDGDFTLITNKALDGLTAFLISSENEIVYSIPNELSTIFYKYDFPSNSTNLIAQYEGQNCYPTGIVNNKLIIFSEESLSLFNYDFTSKEFEFITNGQNPLVVNDSLFYLTNDLNEIKRIEI